MSSRHESLLLPVRCHPVRDASRFWKGYQLLRAGHGFLSGRLLCYKQDIETGDGSNIDQTQDRRCPVYALSV